VDCTKPLARLRMTKSPAELELLVRSAEATMEAQKAAWRAAKPGAWEYQVAGAVIGSYASAGCGRNAFPPIIGSGPNSTVLHYSRNNRRMDAGELLLIDIGAECAMYAGDITRTIPVSGKFSPRQLEIYQAVLQANRDVIAAARPGTTVKRLRQVAIDSLNRRNPPLGQFLNHGVSHHIGLDVHDLADNDEPLRPNAVITVEPGVYLPEENIGIRIEDMVLITEQGARVLTSALPVEPEAIEKMMAAPRP
jgi:Xaa-Pro aminopeptidase